MATFISWKFFYKQVAVTNFLIIGIMLYFCKPILNNLFFKNFFNKKNNTKPIK